MQKEREKVDKEVKETERATGEMEMDRKTQKMRQTKSFCYGKYLSVSPLKQKKAVMCGHDCSW